MMETDNSGSPAPKKDEEEILDLINEMDQNAESDPELILLSAEVPPSGDNEEDVLDLSEEALMDEATGEVTALSENPAAAGNDAEDDEIMVLDIEAPQSAGTDEQPLELSEEVFDLEASLGDIPPLRDETTLMEIADDDLSFSDEAVEGGDETGGLLDPGGVESLLNEPDHEPAGVSGSTSMPDDAKDNFFDMGELPTLLSDDGSEPDMVSRNDAPEYVQHAKDLVQEGFELGEALDAVIDKEMVADADLAAVLGLGLEEASSVKEGAARFDGGVPSVSSAQIEAAIERVLDKMLGQKIDRLLTTAIERAVTHEISRLKRLLSETLSDG